MTKQVINIDSSEFTPTGELVLVKPEALQSEKVSSGGIIIPLQQMSVTSDRPTSGKVVRVGKDTNAVSVDDIVIWPNADGIEFEFNDGEFILLRQKSIIGFKS